MDRSRPKLPFYFSLKQMRALLIRRPLLFATLLLLTLPTFSYAQEEKPSVEQPQEQQPSVEQPQEQQPSVEQQQEQQPSVETLKSSIFKVGKIQLFGNTLIADEALRPLIAPYEGREMTLEEIEKVVKLIQNYYLDEGYLLAQVYLPAQEIDSGVVEIEILEGQIGTIKVEGNRSYTTPFITDRLWGGLPGDVFRQAPFQKSLLLLNELTDLTVEAVLKSGVTDGTADLVVKVKDRFPAHFSLDYDNFGSRNVGEHRISLLASLGNLGSNGDMLSIHMFFASSPSKGDHPFSRLEYTIPVNRWGTQVAFSYSNSVVRVGGEFDILDIRGEGIVGDISVTHPLSRTAKGGSDFLVGITGKSSKNRILDLPETHDDLRVLNLGYKMNGLGGLTSRYLVNVNLVQGLGENFGGMDDHTLLKSPPKGDNSFVKATVYMAYIKQFTPKHLLLLRSSIQGASETLVPMERYSVGGQGTVRGFSESEVSGDSGYMLSTELRSALFEWQQKKLLGALFLDYGRARLKNPLVDMPRSRYLTGGGFGFRLEDMWGSAQVDIGFPIGPDGNSEKRSPILYAQISIRFQ